MRGPTATQAGDRLHHFHAKILLRVLKNKRNPGKWWSHLLALNIIHWFFKRTKLGCPIDSLDVVFHSIKEKNTGKIICWKNACVN